MNTQLLDGIKNLTKANRWQREQFEDANAGKLPLASGTFSYAPDPVSETIRQLEQYVSDCNVPAVENDPFWQQQAANVQAMIDYLKR